MKKLFLAWLMLCALGVGLIGAASAHNPPAFVADDPKVGGGTG